MSYIYIHNRICREIDRPVDCPTRSSAKLAACPQETHRLLATRCCHGNNVSRDQDTPERFLGARPQTPWARFARGYGQCLFFLLVEILQPSPPTTPGAMGNVRFLPYDGASQSHGGAGGWPPANLARIGFITVYKCILSDSRLTRP
jgi:hypothetical protein